MSFNDNRKHLYKHLTRAMVWNMVEGVAKKVLLLPSVGIRDIKAGFESGKVDMNTKFHLFEKETWKAKQIRKECKAMGINFDLHEMDITKQRLGEGWGELGNCGDLSGFDIIYLDFCGYLSYTVRDWIVRNQETLKHSKVAFTFSIGMRNNPLWNEESTDSGFHPPIHGVQFCNNMEASRKAEWTTSMTLDALGMKSTGRKIPYYMEYKEAEKCSSMVFFASNGIKHYAYSGPPRKIYTSKFAGLSVKELKKLYKKEPIAQKRAWITIALKKLAA